MKIGFIGAGKVGCTLGKFFIEGGIRMTGYYSRHIESAKAAADFTGTCCYDELSRLVHDSDAIFITVPDGTITDIYKELIKFDIRGKQICHCSGSISAGEAFPDAVETGALVFSIHPLFPISDKFTTYRELTGAFFCLEGDEKCVDVWKEQLELMGAKTDENGEKSDTDEVTYINRNGGSFKTVTNEELDKMINYVRVSSGMIDTSEKEDYIYHDLDPANYKYE